MRASIQAIVFDLDNTLWDVWPVIVRAEQVMYDHLAQHYPRITAKYSVEALRAERETAAKLEPHRAHDFTYLRKASLRRCATSVGYDAEIAERVFDVFYAARNQVNPYRDVVPALDRLHVALPLYSLTNGNADLNSIGMARYFKASFAARDLGALKPHPSVFEQVLSRIGLPADQVLHVGDDPHADVEGARRAGMTSLWMNRTGAQWDTAQGLPPITVRSLDDLLTWLSKQ